MQKWYLYIVRCRDGSLFTGINVEINKRIMRESEEHGHDTERLIKHYQEMEKQTKRKIFRRAIKEDKVA